MSWRLAKSLVQLRKQVDALVPERDKSSDGSIGNEEHASRTSDHNPWVQDGREGVVTAIDITHDPKAGFDSYAFAEMLRNVKDSRIKYVISNGRIFSSIESPWVWRKYIGTSKHDHHVHVSVKAAKHEYDDTVPWEIRLEKPNKKADPVPEVVVLAKGTRGAAVEELQRLLKVEHVDGYFGPNTDEAVRMFQKVNGLAIDGVVGLYTWEKLRKGK
jgi:peptidoglycan hydrolase-like protein with peptidoglycan-binding domain